MQFVLAILLLAYICGLMGLYYSSSQRINTRINNQPHTLYIVTTYTSAAAKCIARFQNINIIRRFWLNDYGLMNRGN